MFYDYFIDLHASLPSRELFVTEGSFADSLSLLPSLLSSSPSLMDGETGMLPAEVFPSHERHMVFHIDIQRLLQ